jgi:hypothetical protein
MLISAIFSPLKLVLILMGFMFEKPVYKAIIVRWPIPSQQFDFIVKQRGHP